MESQVEERIAFQEELQYRLDIALVIFESAYTSLNSELPKTLDVMQLTSQTVQP